VRALAFDMQAGFAQDLHAGHSAVGYVPREILERPVPLRVGIGTVHEGVTTSSKEAQAFYDQGLAYLHSYVLDRSGALFQPSASV
jgi:hypothetical protein